MGPKKERERKEETESAKGQEVRAKIHAKLKIIETGQL